VSGARLYITCGLPFAGKTTLAREIGQRLGWTYIALDDINAGREVGLSGAPISSLDWSKSYAEAHRQLGQALAEGNTVIYDATNFSRKERARLRTIAARQGAAVTVIYLRLAEGEAQRRWQANRRSRSRYDVRDEDYALVESNFEPPLDDEDMLTYDGSQPAAEWIARTLEGQLWRTLPFAQ
jgi:predicted kinase